MLTRKQQTDVHEEIESVLERMFQWESLDKSVVAKETVEYLVRTYDTHQLLQEYPEN